MEIWLVGTFHYYSLDPVFGVMGNIFLGGVELILATVPARFFFFFYRIKRSKIKALHD